MCHKCRKVDNKQVLFQDVPYDVWIHEFISKPHNLAVELRVPDSEDPSDTLLVSVNTERAIPIGTVAVKDYGFLHGMLNALRQAGVVGEQVASVPSGYVSLPICMLLV
jgi:hypothetical protein